MTAAWAYLILNINDSASCDNNPHNLCNSLSLFSLQPCLHTVSTEYICRRGESHEPRLPLPQMWRSGPPRKPPGPGVQKAQTVLEARRKGDLRTCWRCRWISYKKYVVVSPFEFSAYELSARTKITRHLHPKDLLNLSWSSKALNEFFMTKNSAYMWRHSFRTLSRTLPLPEGIIEPAFATLLFTNVCTVRDTLTFCMPLTYVDDAGSGMRCW